MHGICFKFAFFLDCYFYFAILWIRTYDFIQCIFDYLIQEKFELFLVIQRKKNHVQLIETVVFRKSGNILLIILI